MKFQVYKYGGCSHDINDRSAFVLAGSGFQKYWMEAYD